MLVDFTPPHIRRITIKYKIFAFFPILFAVLFAAGTGVSNAQDNQYVRFNREYSYRMLDQTTEINRKQLLLLRMRQEGILENESLYIGADLTVIGDKQFSNSPGKFGYLMRHPTFRNQGGTSVSEFTIHDAKLQVTGTITPWAAFNFHLLYDPQQSFGSGTLVDINRNQIQLRRGYVLFGQLDKFPFYASIGKMAAPFGLTDTVSPFTASTTWHAFGVLSYGGLIGFEKNGFNISFMALQGGAQFRSANSGETADTGPRSIQTAAETSDVAAPDDVENFTVNASYTHWFAENASLLVGGGYIHGSAYCQPFPTIHFDDCDHNVPAWDIHALLKWDRVTLIGEFMRTTRVWPATHNPYGDFARFAASKVTAFNIGGEVVLPIQALGKDIAVSAEFSKFDSGPGDAPWEGQDQIVIGLEMVWNKNLKGFVEYIRINGYVPLNVVSGPDPTVCGGRTLPAILASCSKDDGTGTRVPDPDKLATTHSESDAKTDILLFGFRLAL